MKNINEVEMTNQPEGFMLASAPELDAKLAELGPAFSDRYIVTAAMAWDTEKDEACLLFSVLVDDKETESTAWGQVFYLKDVAWIPAAQIAQLSRTGVEKHLIKHQEPVV